MRSRLSWPVRTGLLVFLLHVLTASCFPFPAFRKYSLAAERFLSGELANERLMDFSPFYFHLAVAAERLLPHPEQALQVLQIVLVAIAAGWFYAVLSRRFGHRLAALAVLVLAFDRHLLIYERILEPEACLFFFLIGFLYFFERPERWAGWIAGGFAALGLATRPTFLPVFALVPLCLWWRGERGRPLLRRAAAVVSPVAAMLVVLMLRAAAVTGDPLTPVMNPGTVFFEGNNPLSHGTSAIYPPITLLLAGHGSDVPDSAHQHYRGVARADTGRELSVREVNVYWGGRAFAFLRATPDRALRLALAKLVRTFHSFRWHDVSVAWEYDDGLWLPAVPFALIAALAISGGLFEARRWRASLLFYLFAAAQLGVMLVFYVSARQRLVLLPALLFFAAAAVERAGRMKRRGPFWGLIALVTLSLTLPNHLIRDELHRRRGRAQAGQHLAEVRAGKDREPPARLAELAVRAMASAPWWLDSMRPPYLPQEEAGIDERVAEALAERADPSFPGRFDRAVLALELGRIAEAEPLLAELVREGGTLYRGAVQSSEPLFYLGRAAALGGDRARAVKLLERALERSPGDPFTLAELLALTGDERHLAPLVAYGSGLDARYLLGRALLVHARPREAAAAFAFVVRRLPELREGRIHLAAALGALGRYDEGVEHYLSAAEQRVAPIQLSPYVVALFRGWAAAHRDQPEVQMRAADVLYQHGRLREALALVEAVEPQAGPRQRWAAQRTRLRAALQAW